MTLNVIYYIVFGKTLEPGDPESDPELQTLDNAFATIFQTLGAAAIEDYVPFLHVSSSLCLSAPLLLHIGPCPPKALF